jgi:hypothetical protein
MAKKTETELTKASFNVRPELIKKLKYIALVDDTTQTDIVNNLLSDYVEKWEKKNGPANSKR